MNFRKVSIAVLFLSTSATVLYAQEVKNDTVNKEKKIEGVVLQGSSNKKTETAVMMEQKKAIIQKQAVSAEEISRKGISNVEQGLTKVTGITESKFAELVKDAELNCPISKLLNTTISVEFTLN